MDGVIVVDKPSGWTSHDVVGKMRRLAGTRRIGHLGTLDPMATGVLPLVVDRATRLARFFTKADKVYEAEVRFGFATTTYDADGEPMGTPVEPAVSIAELERVFSAFRGTFSQTPPPVSAKKIDGVPAYKLARKGRTVELAPVEVSIEELTVQSFDGARARILVRCSGGTYVRSLAHDAGAALGCGAHLSALRRLRSGMFGIEQALTIDALAGLAEAGAIEGAVIPAAELLPEFPAVAVDEVTAGRIRQGREFHSSPFTVRNGAPHVRAIDGNGRLVAVGQIKLPNLYHPILVL